LHDIVETARFTGYFESFLSHYRSLHETHCDGLYPGTLDMLNGLRHRGYRLGIVTGKSREAWNLTLSQSSLEPFDVVITDDDVTYPKPHPEGLVAALRAMDIEPSRAIYIGDSLLDCQAAHAAKMRFGAALWSKSVEEIDTFRKAVGSLGDAHCFSTPRAVIDGLNAWADPE
jgi:HAD superfamily hydrolase (TIGR01509 family)